MQKNGRELLIYLSILYNGDYWKIRDAVARNEYPFYGDVVKEVDNLESNVVTYLDPEYPKCLKEIPQPPLVLFYYGDISLISDENYQRSIGVIGTRKPSDYGIAITKKIVRGIARDHVIISGLAYGIDAVAHNEALIYGGKCVAVLGSGIDLVYPEENKDLYQNIINRGGLVISEYPHMATPDSNHFPIRNRIIAGLSRAILVTEAYDRSGTSITVGHVISLNKDVMAVPYPYDDRASYCNKLINEGATLVINAEEVKAVMEGQIEQ